MGKEEAHKECSCVHKYTFDERTKTMVFPATICGVCEKCGDVKKIRYSEYKKMKAGGADKNGG